MFCPECGREVEYNMKFCPGCGRYLTDTNPFDSDFDSDSLYSGKVGMGYSGPAPKSDRGVMLTLIVVIMLVASSLIGVIILYEPDGPEVVPPYVPVDPNDPSEIENVILDAKDYKIYLGDSFKDGDLIGKCVWPYGSYQMNFEVNPTLADKYVSYEWKYIDSNGKVISMKETESSAVYHEFDEGEEFTIEVNCHAIDGTVTTYSGLVTIDYQRSYQWIYQGHVFQVTTSFGEDELEAFQPQTYYQKVNREPTFYNECTKYVVMDSVINEMSDQLEKYYLDMKGQSTLTLSTDYANFVLAFVQIAFDYRYDSSQYGQEEYFAYPLETIFSGEGDCEDTSILCAALLTASGYQSAICLVPGHAMAGVALSDNNVTPTISQEIVSKNIGGLTYYAGETTTSYYVPFGISSAEDGFQNNINLGLNGDGFYPVTSV